MTNLEKGLFMAIALALLVSLLACGERKERKIPTRDISPTFLNFYAGTYVNEIDSKSWIQLGRSGDIVVNARRFGNESCPYQETGMVKSTVRLSEAEKQLLKSPTDIVMDYAVKNREVFTDGMGVIEAEDCVRQLSVKDNQVVSLQMAIIDVDRIRIFDGKRGGRDFIRSN